MLPPACWSVLGRCPTVPVRAAALRGTATQCMLAHCQRGPDKAQTRQPGALALLYLAPTSGAYSVTRSDQIYGRLDAMRTSESDRASAQRISRCSAPGAAGSGTPLTSRSGGVPRRRTVALADCDVCAYRQPRGATAHQSRCCQSQGLSAPPRSPSRERSPWRMRAQCKAGRGPVSSDPSHVQRGRPMMLEQLAQKSRAASRRSALAAGPAGVVGAGAHSAREAEETSRVPAQREGRGVRHTCITGAHAEVTLALPSPGGESALTGIACAAVRHGR